MLKMINSTNKINISDSIIEKELAHARLNLGCTRFRLPVSSKILAILEGQKAYEYKENLNPESIKQYLLKKEYLKSKNKKKTIEIYAATAQSFRFFKSKIKGFRGAFLEKIMDYLVTHWVITICLLVFILTFP
mmetsp:Transcript_14029/g.12392  ORF Transcript_14029/g.12392 Transcript_14029/m.12392 type:complete len:133 (-) Transcript_14029:190-588(-)